MTINQQSKGDVLVVDDFLENVSLLANMLTKNGYEVRQVLNGKQALKTINYEPPELILLDIMMPEIDGYQVCQQIKSSPNPRVAEIPVIFISAKENVFDKVRAFEVGGADYITKPFFLAEVLCRVKTHLENYRHQKILAKEIAAREKAQQELNLANQELARLVNRLERLVNLDGLTEISNRRYFEEFLARQWKHSLRYKQPLSLMMIDIDFFKFYNDTYGHLLGDKTLKTVAQTLATVVSRPTDLAARYGGEEFVVILPDTDIDGAKQVARKIAQEIKKLAIPHKKSSVSPYVTLSIGISSVVPTKDRSPLSLVKQADSALYQSKQQGRNRITTLDFSQKLDKKE